MSVSRAQRHTKANRCQICGGADQDPRGAGKRCAGFDSEDGKWCLCSREELAGAIQPNSAGLYPHRLEGECDCGTTHGIAREQPSTIEATYDYRDERGRLLFQVVRKRPKRFLQRKPDGAGGWLWKIGDTPRVLYRLPDLLKADKGVTVWIAEGEKDVEALVERQLLATCNPHGAGKWGMVAEHAAEVLRGRAVVVIADADEPGRAHAKAIRESLQGVAKTVQVIELDQKDPAAYFAAGGTVEKLRAMAEAGAAWKRHGVRRLCDSLRDVYEACQRPEPPPSVSCCHRELDQVMGGFRPGRVTVLGAVTSWGKSSYAVMVLDEALKAGKRVLLVSGEDGERTYANRIAARRANISAFRLRDQDVVDADKARLLHAVVKAEPVPYFLNGIGRPAEALARILAEVCAEQPYDLVIVDYLQAFGAERKQQDRRNEVTQVARAFTDAIKNANAAGLLLSQIKRMEQGKTPTMHDLKESGDVENMAEHVLIGHMAVGEDSRTGEPEHKRFVKVEKNKDGPKVAGAIWMPFVEVTASFQRVGEGA